MTTAANRTSRVDRIAAHQYLFRSVWQLPADVQTVFATLRDLWSYPDWWPEFRQAEQTSDDEGVFALRGRLPLTLTFTLHRDVEDQKSGVLRALAAGDIEGSVEWRLTPGHPHTTAAFTEQVTLQHRWARRADVILRPILTWNHRAVMKSGERGLTAYLAEQPRI
jgi:hypothetical protein